MTFPRGFDPRICRELGLLIEQAYAEFDAYEEERPWVLQDYALETDLSYDWMAGGLRNLDATLRRVARSKRREATGVPIGFLARRERRLYLVLRGTRTVGEWARNATFGLAPYLLPEHGKVHDGFLQVYARIREGLIAGVKAAGGLTPRLLVAGHSLGAALATLAVPDLEASTGARVEALYTFGSPRVGDDGFVQAFNRSFAERSFRLANSSDLVTALPPPVPIAAKLGGYFSHVETSVDFTVQRGGLEQNHAMETYLDATAAARG